MKQTPKPLENRRIALVAILTALTTSLNRGSFGRFSALTTQANLAQCNLLTSVAVGSCAGGWGAGRAAQLAVPW